MVLQKLMVAYMDDQDEHIYYFDKEDQLILMENLKENVPSTVFLEAGQPERFLEVPKIMNVEAFSWMVEFESANQNNELLKALNADEPFEAFLGTLKKLDLYDEWKSFQQKKAQKRMENWITEYELHDIQKQPD